MKWGNRIDEQVYTGLNELTYSIDRQTALADEHLVMMGALISALEVVAQTNAELAEALAKSKR